MTTLELCDEITAQFKGGQLFKFRPKAAHWFASNYLPKSSDVTGGFSRRWLILSFNRVVAPGDIIRNLDAEIVYHELDAIVAWALEAMPDLIKRGTFTYPKSHFERLEDMRLSISTVRQWMGERLVFGPEYTTIETQLWNDYWVHMGQYNARLVGKQTFHADLTSFLTEEGKGTPELVNGLWTYRGIGLKSK